jgi:Uma2 family endonuclease
VSVQNPIQLTDYSEPQPDIALLQPRADYYASALPRPDDIVLVIEVADTSIDYDRDEKVPRYAAAGIAEVWLIDVDNQVVEHYTAPRHGQYGTKRTYEIDQIISTSLLPTLKLAVSEILA